MEFACVLKTGGDYHRAHVARLRSMLPRDIPLACLTDLPDPCVMEGVRFIQLDHGWPGWWSKIELFRPGIFPGPVLYLDLDVQVMRDPRHLFRHSFTMCRDFLRPEQFNSSVMSWCGDMSGVYDQFLRDPEGYQRQYRRWPSVGDQAFIERRTVPDAFEDGAVVSWRKDCGGGIPESATVVAFHGKPKPWEIGR